MNETQRRFRIDLGYDGTEFYGSQRQRGVRTVQQVVEQALRRLTGDEVTIVMAGRTDRGVHAVGQVASATIGWRREAESLRYALDSLTPDDVSILEVSQVHAAFHPRFDAREREYRYRVWNAQIPPTLTRRFVWHIRSCVDVERMNAAAMDLIGCKDFSSFAGDGLGVLGSAVDCTRTVTMAEWRRIDDAWEHGAGRERVLEFRVRADRFLPHMVRNIVGSLIEVGREAKTVDWFASLVAGRDRRLAGPAAPAQGLVLWTVEYPEGSEV